MFLHFFPVTREMEQQIHALCRRSLKSIMDDNVRTTRSVSKVHSLIGYTPRLRLVPLTAKVIRRRWTESIRQNTRPTVHQDTRQTVRRSTRFNSLQPCSPIEQELWCVCRQPDKGTPMIFCENQQCTIKWFHFNCMKITFAPKGTWFCPNCSILRNK